MSNIFIPSSVEVIDEYAFSMCNHAQQIIFENPTSLTKIKNRAFASCREVVCANIPFSVKYIASDAFDDCLSIKKRK